MRPGRAAALRQRFPDLHFTEWLQAAGINVKVGEAADAVEAIAAENQFHPVRDWLDGLEWDGVKRVGTWLTYYLGVERSVYSEAVGQRWLLSAVARIIRPGCKADHCLVLEGDQGRGKSSALRALVGDEWFTDEIGDLGGKDAAMQTRGIWLIELGELEHLSRQEVGRVKVTLPTRNPGDRETTVEVPFDPENLSLSNALQGTLARDIRRRLRDESKTRIHRKGTQRINTAL